MLRPAVLIDDFTWSCVEPLIPPPKARPRGRPRVDDRTVLGAIALRELTGVPWSYVRAFTGCSGVTAWRRKKEWVQAGAWGRIWGAILQNLRVGLLPTLASLASTFRRDRVPARKYETPRPSRHDDSAVQWSRPQPLRYPDPDDLPRKQPSASSWRKTL